MSSAVHAEIGPLDPTVAPPIRIRGDASPPYSTHPCEQTPHPDSLRPLRFPTLAIRLDEDRVIAQLRRARDLFGRPRSA